MILTIFQMCLFFGQAAQAERNAFEQGQLVIKQDILIKAHSSAYFIQKQDEKDFAFIQTTGVKDHDRIATKGSRIKILETEVINGKFYPRSSECVTTLSLTLKHNLLSRVVVVKHSSARSQQQCEQNSVNLNEKDVNGVVGSYLLVKSL